MYGSGSFSRSPMAPPRTAAQRRQGTAGASSRSHLSTSALRSNTERRKSVGDTGRLSANRPNRMGMSLGASLGPTSTSIQLQHSRPRSMGTAGTAGGRSGLGSTLGRASGTLAQRRAEAQNNANAGSAGSSFSRSRGNSQGGSSGVYNHDLGATQSLQLGGASGSFGSATSNSTIGGKSMWRLPPVSQQEPMSRQSTAPQMQPAPQSQSTSTNPEYFMTSAAANIPHPAKMASGGEDANFICPNAVGVADGVGGWAAHGIDAGEYARGLMTNGKEGVDVHGLTDPLAVLWHAYRGVSHLGSSTCLILVLDKERCILHSANLGDSAFRVIRNGAIHYRCKLGQHYFNCPYQLGSHSSDLPSDSVKHSLSVQDGDIVVSGSDGLFDNLFDTDILNSIVDCGDDVNQMAQNLAQAAREASGNSHRQGPFALEAIASGIQFQGGKFDDVTVVVSRVDTKQPSQPVSEDKPPPTASRQTGWVGTSTRLQIPETSLGSAGGSGPAACKVLRAGAANKYREAKEASEREAELQQT